MDTCTGQGDGRRRRRRDGRGPGLRRPRATGVAAAAVVYLAEDLRNPDGLSRPVLRRAAYTLAASRRAALRHAGEAYLRLDPPTAELVEPDESEAPPQLPAPGHDTPSGLASSARGA